MVIMFMIAAASALAAILVTVCALMMIVDTQHRVRATRIDARKHWVWRARGRATDWVAEKLKSAFRVVRAKLNGKKKENGIKVMKERLGWTEEDVNREREKHAFLDMTDKQ